MRPALPGNTKWPPCHSTAQASRETALYIILAESFDASSHSAGLLVDATKLKSHFCGSLLNRKEPMFPQCLRLLWTHVLWDMLLGPMAEGERSGSPPPPPPPPPPPAVSAHYSHAQTHRSLCARMASIFHS